MSYELPKIKDSGVIPFDHFPTRMQCFIFRNWGMIEPHVLAKVLGCREEQVRELAVMMGLEEYPSVSEEWLTKGYITIIRANWHLCSYEQLAYMLGWSLDKLAFIIREDDFLGTKMGGTKPVLPELKYAELTDDQKKRTDFVKRSVEDTLKNKVPEPLVPLMQGSSPK